MNAIRMQPSAREEARAEFRDLLAWNPVTASAALLELGWKLQDRYQLSYWDALIVAAAKNGVLPLFAYGGFTGWANIQRSRSRKSVSSRSRIGAVKLAAGRWLAGEL